MSLEPPQLWTIPEAARFLKCCPNTIRNRIRDGELHRIKAGKQVRFTTEELCRFVERHQD